MKKLGIGWSAGAACIAGLLMIHGFLAGFAPCPYRSDLSIVLAGNGHVHHTEAGHQSDLPCPFDLMHALYGVFHAAPPPSARATLVTALVIKVSAEPVGPHWLLSRRFDRPPRSL